MEETRHIIDRQLLRDYLSSSLELVNLTGQTHVEVLRRVSADLNYSKTTASRNRFKLPRISQGIFVLFCFNFKWNISGSVELQKALPLLLKTRY